MLECMYVRLDIWPSGKPEQGKRIQIIAKVIPITSILKSVKYVLLKMAVIKRERKVKPIP
ncbi:hypothetical protein D3C84_1196450 [compost metagenome]